MPTDDEDEVRAALDSVRKLHPEATHHCWAYRVGHPPRERSSDDGEPGGTAGPPILQILRGAEVSDVLAVVVRWFGGVKLGKGGLVRAYAEATRLALAELATTRKVPRRGLAIEIPYSLYGAVKRLVRPPEVELVLEAYDDDVRLELLVQDDVRGALEDTLASLGLTRVGDDPSWIFRSVEAPAARR